MKPGRLALGILPAFLVVPFLLSPTIAAPQYGEWANPVRLADGINSAFTETAPTLSKDGRSLYFSSSRPCVEGDTVLDPNLWVARRSADDALWGTPVCLAINVDGFEDSAAAFSRDGHWMFFVSNRPGSLVVDNVNSRDLWVSWRAHVHDDDGWAEPVHAGAVINSTSADAGPTYFDGDGTRWPQLFFTSARSGTFDIWVSDVLGGGQFGTPQRVDELNTTTLVEARPSIRHDGLELFFFRGVGSSANFDIYSATRPDPAAPWSEPRPVAAPVNTAANEQQAAIASDRRTLFFASNRESVLGDLDIWVTMRSK
jgi:hypothetical protein